MKTNHICLVLLNVSAAAELLKLSPSANKTPNCDTMKVAVVFVLLFATVLCRPAKQVSVSSSASSEEVVKAEVPVAPAEIYVAATPASSDESTASSDEDAQATADPTTSSDTVSDDSQDSEDSDDDDEAEESETEEDDDSSHSSESGESSTPATVTVTPVMVTEEPVAETTVEPIVPTIVTDSGRGDSMGGYPSDYKSIIYVEDKSYQKVPAPYKSYEFLGTGKKMAYDMTDGNEVEKTLTVYKALQVHTDLEEDTSTPEVEHQGLDASQDQDVSYRQASFPDESTSTSDASTTDASTTDGSSSDGSSSDGSSSDGSTSDATTSESESSSAPEEEEESASTASDSTSASQESEDEESSEEATATPGAADSESDESDSAESDSDEDKVTPDTTTDMPAVITAK